MVCLSICRQSCTHFDFSFNQSNQLPESNVPPPPPHPGAKVHREDVFYFMSSQFVGLIVGLLADRQAL